MATGPKREGSPLTYRQAGVDIDAGNALVEAIKPLAKSTARRGADADLGGFGGLFDLKAAGFRRSGAGRRHRRRRHQAQDRHRDRPARHASASTWSPCASTTSWCRAPSRCSSSTISRPAALDVESARAVDRRHRRRLPAGRLRADRRRDRGDAGPLRDGRLRPRRLRRRRGRTRQRACRAPT